MNKASPLRQTCAEGIGTALLLIAVVGSGIMAERLSAGNQAVALLANTLATAAALAALILVLGPVSGAHFNPLVSAVEAARRRLSWRELPTRIAVQIAGAFAGVWLAHRMFGLPDWSASRHERAGGAHVLSEAVATFGLLFVIVGGSRQRSTRQHLAVAGWIAAAYWCTASTSFANPAVTLARSATDTFAGVRPADVPGLLLGQTIGAIAGALAAIGIVPDAGAQVERCTP